MAKPGIEQPQPGSAVENVDTGTIEEVIEGLDGKLEAGNLKPETVEVIPEEIVPVELDADGNPVEVVELDADGNPVEVVELDADGNPVEEADPAEEEHKEVFSDEGYKIFRSRIGKEKTKTAKVAAELATAQQTLSQLQKETDPNVRAVAAEGIDSRFIETADAQTLTEAAKVEHRINWLENLSEDPNGYEDTNGKLWTQTELLVLANKASRSQENQALLSQATTIRTAAQARQAEVMTAGFKALADQAKAKAALKKKPVKKAAPSPSAALPAAAAPQPTAPPTNGFDEKEFLKRGGTDEAIASMF